MASIRPSQVFAVAATVLLVAGCGIQPTYPKARLAQSLEDLLTKDHLHASVRFLEHTLAVHLDHPGALLQQNGTIQVGPAFDEATRAVLTSLHRVLLSTDAEVRFYVVLISDPTAPGAYLTMVRYLDDVRRANANAIDVPEMFARTIFEMNYLGASTPLTLDQYVPRDIRLEEFLSWQVARRIQRALTDELQLSGKAMVGRCTGRFQNGEFDFTLDVAPPANAPLPETTMQEVFQTSTNVIAKVLSSYHFNAFNAVRLIHPLSGRNLVLPKAHLDVFR